MVTKTFMFAKTLKDALDSAEYTDNSPISFSLDSLIGSQFNVTNWENVKLADQLEIVAKATAYGYDVLS